MALEHLVTILTGVIAALLAGGAAEAVICLRRLDRRMTQIEAHLHHRRKED